MQFILGVSTSLVLFALCGLSFYLGQRYSKPKPSAIQANEQEQRKAAELHEHFQALMNYDMDTAMQRKRVR